MKKNNTTQNEISLNFTLNLKFLGKHCLHKLDKCLIKRSKCCRGLSVLTIASNKIVTSCSLIARRLSDELFEKEILNNFIHNQII